MNQKQRRWTLVLCAALGLTCLGWLFSSPSSSPAKSSNAADLDSTAPERPQGKPGLEAVSGLLQGLSQAQRDAPTEEELLHNKVQAFLAEQWTCPVPQASAGSKGRLHIGLIDYPVSTWKSGQITSVGAHLEPTTEGELQLEGFKPVTIRWRYTQDGLICYIPTLEEEGGPWGLFGLVKDTQGQTVHNAQVSGCGNRRVESDEDGFYLTRSSSKACALLIQGSNSSLEIRVPAGPGDQDLGDLTLPDQNLVMGLILVAASEQGEESESWTIDGVLPGSPAATKGLIPGQNITRVNGRSTAAQHPLALLPRNTLTLVEMEVDGQQFKLGFSPLETLYIQDGLSPEEARATALSWGNGWTY